MPSISFVNVGTSYRVGASSAKARTRHTRVEAEAEAAEYIGKITVLDWILADHVHVGGHSPLRNDHEQRLSILATAG